MYVFLALNKVERENATKEFFAILQTHKQIKQWGVGICKIPNYKMIVDKNSYHATIELNGKFNGTIQNVTFIWHASACIIL